MPSERPNILVLMTDQQRYDSLGCYDAEFAHTPNLDRLASEGVLFERCYVNNPICTPSRASMFTGKHLPGHGVYRLYDNLPKDEVLFPEHLQGLGYTTALFGKLHVSSIETESYERHPHDGFDVYEPCLEGCLRMDAPYQAYADWLEGTDPDFCARLKSEGRKLLHPPRERHMTYWAAERTIDFLRQRASADDGPFFCMMSIFEPHNPYEHYPKEMGELVDAEAIPAPQQVDPEALPEPPGVENERNRSHLGGIDSLSDADVRKMRHGYHSAVAYSDAEFGRVLEALADAGLAENTLVIFTSDHGDMLGDRRLLVKGAFFYEANVHVPLIMRWPAGFEGNKRAPALVQLHDLAATVLNVAGMEPDKRAEIMPDAADLLPVASGDAKRVRDEAICCYRNSGIAHGGVYWDPPVNATMLRDERYKLNIWHDSDATADRPGGELYDMAEDPEETRNLWSDTAMQGVRLEMTQRMLNWQNRQERQRGSRGGETRPQRSVHGMPPESKK
jgi:arylsulfatase